MGPQSATDALYIDMAELIADLTAISTAADAGKLGQQPALLAALQRAAEALQSVG
jgi:hypothetical protein